MHTLIELFKIKKDHSNWTNTWGTVARYIRYTEILNNIFLLDDIYEDDIDDELEIARLFKSGSDVDYLDEVDNSTEVKTICINKALKSLKTVYIFLIQQENASGYMKLIDKIEKFIKREQINSMQQTTIDKYFK
ncbi:hypothetical protein C1646_771811 [Rhizophagus diaphanus]|nr:hypothetical protein C1646_771811 [Rhizophagus diaphanus] [Rhizophagus sp. MUCL 43196]